MHAVGGGPRRAGHRCVLASSDVTIPSAVAGALHHVLLIGPEDDARRALHVMLDRAGKQVAALADIEAARAFLARCRAGERDHACDAVIARGELAAALCGGEACALPPVIAVVRPRDLAAS